MQQKALGFTQGFSKGLKVMDGQVSAVASSLNRVGVAFGAAGLAAGAALGWAGKAGLDFEQAISKVGAVSLLTRDQIADLEAKALELGRTTKFTATEAANAMEVMGRAGFTNAEILQGIGGIMNAAAAEGADMAEVTSHVSNVLKGMGLQASEAARVADVLALASARTNSSISTLGESMKNLSPVAKQFGISLEDSVGMVALLQDVGLDASEAGTATATMLTKLAKPADEVAKKMKEMGVVFKDTKGNMLPPLEIFNAMQEASKKLGGNMDTVAFFADLVGLRGQKAALNLQDLFTSEKGQALTKELRNAEGTAKKMADLSMDNTIGAWTLFTSAVDGVKVALFGLVGGELKAAIDKTTEWIGKNQELIVSGAKEFIQDIRDALPTIITNMERIGKAVIVFYTFAAAVKAVNVAMAVFTALMQANPIILITYAVVAAIAAIWAFWPEISEFFSKLWKGVVKVGKWIGSALVAIWDRAVAFGKNLASTIGTYFSGLIDAAKPYVQGFVDFIVGLATIFTYPFRWAFQKVTEYAGYAWEWIKAKWAPIGQWFSDLWGGVEEKASSVWGAITGAAQVAGDWIKGIWSDIGYAASDAWDGITSYAQSAYDWVLEIWAPIGEFFSGLWEGIASTFQSTLGWVLEKLSWLTDAAAGLVGDVSEVGQNTQANGINSDLGGNVISPQERTASYYSESKTTHDVNLNLPPGATATTKSSGPGGITLRTQPTGAM